MNDLIDTLSNNSATAYLAAAAVFAAGLFVTGAIRELFERKVKAYLERKEFRLRGFTISVIENNVLILLRLASFYAAVYTLYLAPRIERLVDISALLIMSFFAARIAADLVEKLLTGYRPEAAEGEPPPLVVPRGVVTLLKTAVWAAAAAFLLDNLGFNITTLLAGVGIGGVAVALASQAILGDLFSYFVILFDKPFQRGDFIIVGDKMGAVEYVGLKTTRLKSLGGEELVFSNTDLTNSRVHNYKKMDRRRVAFKIGVTYETPSEKLKRIPAIIKDIITNIEGATFDRSHFQGYGDFALVFETVYYVAGPDYNIYMDIQQQINFAIKDELEKLGVEFAYPTQTVYLRGAAGQPLDD